MNEELFEKIKKDLEQSGFGSEMRAVRTFLESEWNCTSSYHYIDSEEGRTREIDLIAYIKKELKPQNDKELQITYEVVSEVKKTQSPWVVFKEKKSSNKRFLNSSYIYGKNLKIKGQVLNNGIDGGSLISKMGWVGYGVHESFKKPDQPSKCYQSFLTVTKASNYIYEFNKSRIQGKSFTELATSYEYSAHKKSYFAIIQPIIILDGILVSANLNETGELELEEIPFAPLRFAQKTKSSGRSECIIDIVTLENLPEYIQVASERCQFMTHAISSTFEDKAVTHTS